MNLKIIKKIFVKKLLKKWSPTEGQIEFFFSKRIERTQPRRKIPASVKRVLWKREKIRELKITAIGKDDSFLIDLYNNPRKIISSVKGATKQLRKKRKKSNLIEFVLR